MKYALLVLLWTIVPVAAAMECPVTRYGAVPDGTTVSTAAVQQAIMACNAAGGGRVVIPGGTFVIGTVRLLSNIELHLSPGAVLKGSPHVQDYAVGTQRYGMILAENARNISITGTGVIDAAGNTFMDTTRAKHMPPEATQYTHQRNRFREVSSGLGDGPYFPLERPFQTIIISGSQNVTLRDVTIRESPFWTLHIADCTEVLITGIRILNSMMVPNADGIDVTSSSNVFISDSIIRGGDDAIVLTGYDHHFDLPGFTGRRRDSENITVTNCVLQSRSSAIRIGGADQNSMRYYTFSNLTITDSNRGIGLFVRDVGSIEEMTFTNIIIDTRLHTGDWWGNGEPIHLSAVRNVTEGTRLGKMSGIKFSHIRARGESGILLYGSDESIIEDVSFEDVSLTVAEGPLTATSGGAIDLRPIMDPRLALFGDTLAAFDARLVKNLRIEDMDLNWDVHTAPAFFKHALKVDGFDGLILEDIRGTGIGAETPVLIRNGSRLSGEDTPLMEQLNVTP